MGKVWGVLTISLNVLPQTTAACHFRWITPIMGRKLDVMIRKLEECKWLAEQREREHHRKLKYEPRERKLANRAVSQRHELFLALF
jgi:hypothetical protein